MNKTIKTTNQNSPLQSDLLAKAAKVFSRGYMDMLINNHQDFLESGSTGAFIHDTNGQVYLDCYTSSGIFNLGRNNPDIAEALSRAAQITDQGNFVAISEEKALVANRLSRFIPGPLDCFLFTVVRGEAMDAACKLARGFTKKSRLITTNGGWYGDSGFAMSLSDLPVKNEFGSLIPDIGFMGYNDSSSANSMIDASCAAVVIEPVQAENGCGVATREWVQTLRTLCDQTGALLIFDETQTGFGRTGKKFWFQHYNILPDIIIFGEAVTGGMFPMTGLGFTPEVKQFFDAHPLIHLSTFGGHDLGCRTAVAAMDLYDRICPWENAQRQGETILTAIESRIKDNPDILEIKGVGLLISIQFTTSIKAGEFCKSAKQEGIFIVRGIIATDTIVLRPALTLSDKETAQLIDGISTCLQ